MCIGVSASALSMVNARLCNCRPFANALPTHLRAFNLAHVVDVWLLVCVEIVQSHWLSGSNGRRHFVCDGSCGPTLVG